MIRSLIKVGNIGAQNTIPRSTTPRHAEYFELKDLSNNVFLTFSHPLVSCPFFSPRSDSQKPEFLSPNAGHR